MSTPAFREPDDKRARLRRLVNPDTGLFLHLSGKGEVKGTAYAWAGTPAQAVALRLAARNQGLPFPYETCRVERGDRREATHVNP